METHGWEIKKDSVLLREGTFRKKYYIYDIKYELCLLLLSWCLCPASINSKTVQNAVISVCVGTKKNTTLTIPLTVSLSQFIQPAPKSQSRGLLLVIKA